MKKKMMICLAVTAGLLSATGNAVPLQKAHLPASAKWVFHVDFQVFEESALGRLVCHEIQARHQNKLDAIKQFTGSDLLTDLYAVTIVGTDPNEANAASLIYGTFNRERLLAILAGTPDYSESKHGDRTLYRWQERMRGKNQVGAFAHDNLIVIAQTQDAVAAMLDVVDGQADALTAQTNPSLWRLTEWTPNVFMATAATNLSELTKGQHHAAILQNSKSMSMMAFEENGDFRLFWDFEANTVEAARQIEQFALGMASYAMLKQQAHPELNTLIQACSLTRTDTNIAFEFSLPSAELISAAKIHVPRLKNLFDGAK